MREFDLILENVRCFFGRHTIPIRPLTFLIGENSSGKTTAMGMLSILWDFHRFPAESVFHTKDYDFGSFDAIASKSSTKKLDSFSLGVRMLSEYEYIAHYRSHDGFSKLSGFSFKGIDNSFKLSLYPRFLANLNGEIAHLTAPDTPKIFGSVSQAMFARSQDELASKITTNTLDSSYGRYVFNPSLKHLWRFTSISPLRSRPDRVYDNNERTYDAKGKHVPAIIARIGEDSYRPKSKKLFFQSIEKFGIESGLFKKLVHKRLGRKGSDPIQILVKVNGSFVNLCDVGYGVSQVLPILVESILNDDEDSLLEVHRLLIQQPEVHLHPRAQAALGSFFVSMAAEHKKTFVIETHSDYILDRVRMDVAAKKIKPEDVIFLYFERKGAEAKVHPIHLDEMGNILDAPDGYRQFFTDETMRLISRG